jgi:hypothetical protein
MGNELVKAEKEMNGNEGVFFSMANFEGAQRMAKMLAESDMVPDQYKKNIPNTVIALEMANRIGASPLAVMQNLYIVYGKPAWSSQFLISCVNTSGKFSPLRFALAGTGDDLGCTAWATDKANERLESPRVTIGMAKAEGWFQKNGSKWKTMPDLMLRYRAATLFARLYAPELTMGMKTEDEIIDITPIVTESKLEKKSFLEKRELPTLSELKTEDTPAAEKTISLFAIFAGKPCSTQQAEAYLRETKKLPETAKLESNKVLCRMIADNPDAFVQAVLDWQDAKGIK